MSTERKRCPVPFDQQPLNEYFALKASWFFRWSTLEVYTYVMNILYIFLTCFVLFLPIVFSVITNNTSFWKALLLNFIVVNMVFVLIFIRLYLGWSYIVKRLISATVFYEESGWYDGQIWIKTIDSLTKDRLIGLYEVTPFITRIKYSLSISTIFLVVNSVLYSLL